jgi:hypothetical protein
MTIPEQANALLTGSRKIRPLAPEASDDTYELLVRLAQDRASLIEACKAADYALSAVAGVGVPEARAQIDEALAQAEKPVPS